MPYLNYKHRTIMGLAAAVPKETYNNLADSGFFSEEDAHLLAKNMGVFERRIAPASICSSDLCQAASEKLFEDMSVNRNEVDVLIFITQTPDYKTPGTSVILQNKLGLPKSCAAYDINLGCSGFINGLCLAFSMLDQPGLNKILLLNGETGSKAYSFKDRNTGLVFGDAGSACLIGRVPRQVQSYFNLESIGLLHKSIMIKAGGSRLPSSLETIKESLQPDGSMRNDEQGVIDSNSLNEFAATEFPRHVKEMLSINVLGIENIDYFVVPLSLAFVNNYLVDKMMIPDGKIIESLDKFGNTGSVSIPLAMVTKLHDELSKPQRLLLTGFGSGVSLASAILETDSILSSDLVEI